MHGASDSSMRLEISRGKDRSNSHSPTLNQINKGILV